jgi:hypothetical protein
MGLKTMEQNEICKTSPPHQERIAPMAESEIETDPARMLTDSPEGIAYLFRWAKAHNAVLYPVHAEIARKHGVSTDGVIIAGPIPTSQDNPNET